MNNRNLLRLSLPVPACPENRDADRRRQTGILLLILGICLLITVAAKSCTNRSNKTKSGSSTDTFVINAPSSLVATAVSTSQINLSWQDNSNNEDGFEIESRQGGTTDYSLIATVGINSASYSDTVPPFLTTYYYRVRAFNTIGDRSAYSNETKATPSTLLTWENVSAGYYHTIARSADGTIWGWGLNNYFQLGTGDIINRVLPIQIDTDTGWQIIASIGYHNIGLKSNDSIWGWGCNSNGQLGLEDTLLDGDIPYQIETDLGWVSVAVGGGDIELGPIGHTLAINSNRTLWVCGFNLFGQLGLGVYGEGTGRNTFTQLGNDSDWDKVSAGVSNSFAIKTDCTLWAWGGNTYGQLGVGGNLLRSTPSQVGTESDWSMIASGGRVIELTDDVVHSIGIKINGTFWAWDDNSYGQLGFGSFIGNSTPRQIGTESNWSLAVSGINHNIAMKNNGTIWSCGWNEYGQLGLGDSVVSKTTFTQIGTDSDWFRIATTGKHTVALKNNGTIWSWGNNNIGQLGLGDNNNRFSPTLVRFGLPYGPSFLTASFISLSQITLSWVDNSDNKNGFAIERKSGRDGSYEQVNIVSANTTYYSDPGPFLPLTTYYYRIRAYNEVGYSIYSNEA
jgi:alpha-tubulin suppressor-like RCC1 family protein